MMQCLQLVRICASSVTRCYTLNILRSSPRKVTNTTSDCVCRCAFAQRSTLCPKASRCVPLSLRPCAAASCASFAPPLRLLCACLRLLPRPPTPCTLAPRVTTTRLSPSDSIPPFLFRWGQRTQGLAATSQAQCRRRASFTWRRRRTASSRKGTQAFPRRRGLSGGRFRTSSDRASAAFTR
jgi:hypothetical protein